MASSLGPISPVACLAEFTAMVLFVIIGCGSAMGIDGSRSGSDTSTDPSWVLLVALTFGLTITALAYATGHLSGGHINCAVTFGLVLAGQCGVAQGLANLAAQLLGSVVGACILCLIFPKAMDQTGGLGSNGLADGWAWHNALVGELLGTFLLMTAVLQTACSHKSAANRAQAPLAIGLAVFAAHAVLLPVDGCSINPTRSFGPALVAQLRYGGEPSSPFRHMWIFWLGPLLGAALAVGHYRLLERASRAEAPEAAEAVAAPPASLQSPSPAECREAAEAAAAPPAGLPPPGPAERKEGLQRAASQASGEEAGGRQESEEGQEGVQC